MCQPQLGQRGTGCLFPGQACSEPSAHAQGPPLLGRVCGTACADTEALRRSSVNGGGGINPARVPRRITQLLGVNQVCVQTGQTHIRLSQRKGQLQKCLYNMTYSP